MKGYIMTTTNNTIKELSENTGLSFDEVMAQVQAKLDVPETAKEESKPTVRLASSSQITKYENDCKYKGVKPVEGYKELSVSDMSSEITRVAGIKKFVKMTSGQRTRLLWLFEHTKLTTPENFENWSIEKASDAIAKGNIYYEKNFAHIPSEKQLSMIRDMFACPDIDSSELKSIPLELINAKEALQLKLKSLYEAEVVIISNTQKHVGTPEASELKKAYDDCQVAIRKTVDEISKFNSGIEALELKYDESSLTASQCSDFIGKWQQVFHYWNSDRASNGQRGLINSMLKRAGQTELSRQDLLQFSKKAASDYINKLQAEGGAPKEYVEQEIELDDSEFRLPNTALKASDSHYDTLNNIIFSLCASLNQHGDDNPIFTSENFDQEFIELVQLANAFAISQEDLIDMLSPLFSKQQVVDMLSM